MSKAIPWFLTEIRRLEDIIANEKETTGLRIENAVLRSERSLTGGGTDTQTRLTQLAAQIAALQQEAERLKARIAVLEKAGAGETE